jgi:indolepyruvate ferredoxin oxidoreductase alpha subunit
MNNTNKKLLLGDEAVALAAIHAGISAAYGYPGTPSTEIMEFILDYRKNRQKPTMATWCSNEKAAYEEALGTSMIGKRAIVTMKHVGLNVAADPFINSILMQINGGLVLAVADDPGMHSSQNEQDSRFYALFAKTICLEPRNQQEAYLMTLGAFDLSEKFRIPVLLRLVTRLSHARGIVIPGVERPENNLVTKHDREGWATIPALARKFYAAHLDLYQNEIKQSSENSPHNTLTINKEFTDYGVITTGLGCNYYEENLAELSVKPSHLHISHYPLPTEKIRKLAISVKKIIVIEEGYSLVESFLRGILPTELEILGKENNHLPSSGELNPDNVRAALGLPKHPHLTANITEPPARPAQLCPGCPHIDTFLAIKDAVSGYNKHIVTSDIGCYSLGFMPPISIIDSILCMGASISMAKGIAETGFHPVIATIGDSTFLHSGIQPLIDAAAKNANITVILMDNSTTAMTGAQETIMPSTKLEGLIEGIGVPKDHIKIITPLNRWHKDNVDAIKKEIEHNGVSVIISRRQCLQILKKS